MKKHNKYFKDSPLAKRLNELYRLKQDVNNAAFTHEDFKTRIMNMIDSQINDIYRKSYAGEAGYERFASNFSDYKYVKVRGRNKGRYFKDIEEAFDIIFSGCHRRVEDGDKEGIDCCTVCSLVKEVNNEKIDIKSPSFSFNVPVCSTSGLNALLENEATKTKLLNFLGIEEVN